MATILADTFDRANQSGWGTASGGGAWTVTNSTVLQIVSNKGSVTPNAIVANAIHDLSQDNDIVITYECPAWIAVTDNRYVMIKANGGNRDGFGLEIGAGTSNNLVIRDTTTSPISTASFTFTPTSNYSFEIDISSGYAMDVYVWETSGSKPGTPTIASAAAARTGAGTKFMMGSNTDGAAFDNLLIVNNTAASTGSMFLVF